ncbi:hypothetical protein PV328_007837 [Microctonus aethiopoides]|uniref:Uncharacterized protein n=1 Tax=Microctonus aethiopoides TaxID=144406 RepID=A0AA39F0W2_9HYME|nr:hypothetical protein PV328_007837 [Microctonus aethiopoides]
MRRYSDVDTAIIEINVHTDRNAKEGENIIMRTDVIVDSHNIVVEPDFEKTINSSADNVVKKFENFHISTDHRVEKEFNDDSTLSSNATDVKSIRNLIQDKSNSEETLKTRSRDVRDEDDDIALLSVSSFGSILISVKANLNSRQHGFACLEDK